MAKLFLPPSAKRFAFGGNIAPRAPSRETVFGNDTYRRALAEYIEKRNDVAVLIVNGTVIVGGQFITQAVRDTMDAAVLKYTDFLFDRETRARLERVQSNALRRVDIDARPISQALIVFANRLGEDVDLAIDDIFVALTLEGERVINGSDEVAGRWWQAEHGRRPRSRETGKLFGSRNVVVGKKVGTGFEWPDPVRLATAEHWAAVEFGVTVSDQRVMTGGWIVPGGKATGNFPGGHRNNARFVISKISADAKRRKDAGETGYKARGNRKPKDADWVGGRPFQSRAKHLLSRTATNVLGSDFDKVIDLFEDIAEGAVEGFFESADRPGFDSSSSRHRPTL